MRRSSLHAAVLAAAALAFPAAASAATWSVQSPVVPSGSAASSFNGASCPSGSWCTAVGGNDPGTGAQAALAERWNGASWAQQTVPTPAGATDVALSGVSCTASNACTAVGEALDAFGAQSRVIARWNGTAWSLQTAPAPAGATGTSLSGVSCTAATACRAVGSYTDASGTLQPLSMSWNGASWTLQAVPAPSGHTGTSLAGISCVSSSACTAVGTTLDATGTPLPYAVAWNGSSWRAQAAAVPSGAAATFLAGVSCTAASACTAVGYATDASGTILPVAERWNGTSWTVQRSATPVGAAGAALLGVSCTSATACAAVGYSYDASGVLSSLAEGWNGTTWAVQSTPAPAGSTATALSGISCSSAAVCTAVGYRLDASGVQQVLALRYV